MVTAPFLRSHRHIDTHLHHLSLVIAFSCSVANMHGHARAYDYKFIFLLTSFVLVTKSTNLQINSRAEIINEWNDKGRGGDWLIRLSKYTHTMKLIGWRINGTLPLASLIRAQRNMSFVFHQNFLLKISNYYCIIKKNRLLYDGNSKRWFP